MENIDEEIFALPFYYTNIGDVNNDTLRNHYKSAKSAFSSLEMILERVKSVDIDNNDFETNFLYESTIVRAIRSYSTILKLFIQIDKFQNGDNAKQLNELFDRMKLIEIISSPKNWLQMSEIEEQFFTDYEPVLFMDIFRNIVKTYYTELKLSIDRCESFISK